MRLFLFRPGALGDTLLCAPLLAGLRRRLTPIDVTLAGHGGAVGLIAGGGLLSSGIEQDEPRLGELFSPSASGNLAAMLGPCDAALGWLSDPDGVVLANLRRLAAGPAAVAPSRPEPGSGRLVAEHLAASLAALGILPPQLPLPPLLFPTPADAAWARTYLRELPAGPLVALHPGSGGARKNWHAAGFAAVAAALARTCTVLLIAGPADEAALREVRSLCSATLWPVVGLGLSRLAALLACCAAFVGNDSGVGHLAALLGVSVVSLFGPTDPLLWRPWGERVNVLSFAGGHECLAPETVVAATLAALEG
ncbi:MAG: glycosyltransferase family 9 protein [Chloroflexota bacterium]